MNPQLETIEVCLRILRLLGELTEADLTLTEKENIRYITRQYLEASTFRGATATA